MALITRISRLFRADFHAVLDRIEEPDVLLRQAIREMEEGLSHDAQRIKVLNHEQGQLMVRKTELEQSTSKIEEELDVCFEAQKDDLARALIKRRLEAERTVKHLTRRCDELETKLSERLCCINFLPAQHGHPVQVFRKLMHRTVLQRTDFARWQRPSDLS